MLLRSTCSTDSLGQCKDVIAGACAFCAAAFEVKEGVEKAGVKLLSEYEGHPSLRRLISEGFSVVTF